jgi:hypothetical protein
MKEKKLLKIRSLPKVLRAQAMTFKTAAYQAIKDQRINLRHI